MINVGGGGSVEPATVISDANGEGKAKWTLGPAGINQSLSASSPGVDPITVSALGIPPSDLVVAQGNNQSAKINTALPVPIVVRVTGGSGVPIPFATISMAITGGGGSVSPQSAVTNALGEVSIRWTLGPTLGLQSATVAAGGSVSVVVTYTQVVSVGSVVPDGTAIVAAFATLPLVAVTLALTVS